MLKAVNRNSYFCSSKEPSAYRESASAPVHLLYQVTAFFLILIQVSYVCVLYG